MKKETLMDAIGQVDEHLIEEANQPKRNVIHWKRWAALAACLALVVTGAALFPRMGGNSAPGGPGGAPWYYYGPLLPLTAVSGSELLGETERELTLDLEDRGNYTNGRVADVTDRYTLTNPTDEDLTVKVAYPFVSCLQDVKETGASLWVNGDQTDVDLVVGDYAGGFQSAGTGGDTLNLIQPDSFEHYAALLSDGGYLASALEGRGDLSDVPVVVYRFTDAWYEGEGTNPSIRAEFFIDEEKTTLLTYGFHGGRYAGPEELSGRRFSIREEHEPGYGEPYYFIVVGEDLRELTTQAYVTGGWEMVDTLDGGVNVERYETDLESALWDAFDLMCELDAWKTALGVIVDPADKEQWFDLFCRHLVSYGVLAKDGVDRYSTGMLEDLDFLIVYRVFYLCAEITIPAGGSAEVSARLNKFGGSPYPGEGENGRIYGYEVATTLGSSLNLSSQKLSILNSEKLTISENSLGLNPAGGVDAVALDPAVACYELNFEWEQSK